MLHSAGVDGGLWVGQTDQTSESQAYQVRVGISESRANRHLPFRPIMWVAAFGGGAIVHTFDVGI